MRKAILGPIVLSMLLVATLGVAAEGGKRSPGTHMKVSGVVSKVQSGVAFAKTPWGQMAITSDSAAEQFKVGDEVEMWVNENNAVIDVHRKGEPAHAHRSISGKLVYASATKKEIKLWTPDGEKTFPLERGRSKLSVLEEGMPVTVELNEAGKVIDLHRGVAVEMTFDEKPRTKPGYHITLDGEVTRIQSGVIYVKTPVGQYTISAKTAPSDAKVGDQVTLSINQENMVIDHHRKGHDKAHRLITGKLIYAGKTKNQIKLWTPEGEQVFPLERMEVKTKPIDEGSLITVELNEDGTVVDLWKNES